MAIVKGVLAAVVAFVVLVLLLSTLGMLGPVEQVICGILAAVVGVIVGRQQWSAQTRGRSPRP